MYVKQIDQKAALELAARGEEVLVMAPITTDPEKWIDYEPNTLEHMLEGCMFFRKEPAMEVELMELTVEPAGQTIEFGPAEPENVQPDPPPSRKEAWPEEGTGRREAGGAA